MRRLDVHIFNMNRAIFNYIYSRRDYNTILGSETTSIYIFFSVYSFTINICEYLQTIG